MKLPLKYIAILVVVSLTAIFAYQAYWLVNMYHSMKEQTGVAIMNSIRNADHIELFMRVDSISEVNEKERMTGVQTGTRGEISFSASFSDKDEEGGKPVMKRSIINDTIDISDEIPIDPSEETSPRMGIGEYFSSLEKMALSLQQGLHSMIDSAVVSINIVRFDSILTADLRKSTIDIIHYTELVDVKKDSIMASTFPADINKEGLQQYEHIYDVDGTNAFHVYTEPVGKHVLRQMRGILIASFIILIVLGFSFWYLIRVLLKQKTLEEMKTDFTNNITHELKTPIAVAYAATDALLNFNQAEEKVKRDKYLLIAQEQLQRLSGLVEQILSISMEQRKTFRLKAEEVEVATLVHSLVELHALKAGEQVRFVVEIEPKDVTLFTDRTHFSNIISNLIDNAVKYSPESTTITIKSRIKENKLEISVADKGIGISGDKQKHIFDKFYRVPQGNLHNVKGYGLGLYYVKNMMDKLGGTIHLHSEPGKGSVFTLVFDYTE
ncbi:HAMP domain-containing histidine kinase [Bacteroides sp. OttesenSCG-928-E20]|nr:HAMP domain-containing histidine kinase [Bacteroides sp. OttesenSCG-928-N06]MDL2299273.1 HAMP domain-containing histidine kinase [Bacteroides sp. OttesenSCG-928-E20]